MSRKLYPVLEVLCVAALIAFITRSWSCPAPAARTNPWAM